jgi:predicted nucleotidyltransferase
LVGDLLIFDRKNGTGCDTIRLSGTLLAIYKKLKRGNAMMNITNWHDIQTLAIPLFDRFNIRKAAVFGSFARNENTQQSDVDLLVDFTGSYDLFDLVGLKQELEVILNRKVDLLTFKSLLNEEFDKTILEEAKLIYEKN